MWTVLLFCLGTSCSCSLVLDRDSVLHAFNDTVDLFTALRGIHTVQTQRPCQNRLSIIGVEPWGLRHRSRAAGLWILSLWIWETGNDCFKPHKFHTSFEVGNETEWNLRCFAICYNISVKENSIQSFSVDSLKTGGNNTRYRQTDHEVKTL